MMNDHERMEVDVSEWLSLTQLRGGTLSYTEESWCVYIYSGHYHNKKNSEDW